MAGPGYMVVAATNDEITTIAIISWPISGKVDQGGEA